MSHASFPADQLHTIGDELQDVVIAEKPDYEF